MTRPFAARTFVGTTWVGLTSSMDSVSPGATVHWARYHLLPDTALKGDPMLLNVQVDGGFTLYLNGQYLVRSDAAPLALAHAIPGLSLPLSFRCDGSIEVLAFTLRGQVQAKGKGEMELYFVNEADRSMPRRAADA